MKIEFIDPHVNVLSNAMPNEKRIEYCGRVCYDSRDKITENSAGKFIAGIIQRGHESVLEHSNIIIRTLTDESTFHLAECINEAQMYVENPIPIRNCGSSNENAGFYDNIWSGNVRAWRTLARRMNGEAIIQNLFLGNPMFEDTFKNGSSFGITLGDKSAKAEIIQEDPLHRDVHKIVTVEITCDRGVSHELVRHRVMSFSQQSTRYVNFNKGIKFIKPWWWDDNEKVKQRYSIIDICEKSANAYKELTDTGETPQFARAVLPNALATQICVTGTVKMWKDFLKLREDKAAHPDMRVIAKMIHEQVPELNDTEEKTVVCGAPEECVEMKVMKEWHDSYPSNKDFNKQDNTKDNVGSAVYHPSHYQGAHECMDEMIAMFGRPCVMDFCKCNVYKYRYRANMKNGKEDIEKAENYATFLMNMQDGKKWNGEEIPSNVKQGPWEPF